MGFEAWDLVASGKKHGMSVAYHINQDEWRDVDGIRVRLLKSVTLREISLCTSGAVRQAHCSLVDVGSSLCVASKDGAIGREGSYVQLVRALQRLSDSAK
jgi:phage head maturation protease